MTQMGLDYQKHLETKRHNLLTENISQQDADTRVREADTHERQAYTQAYLASFKDREVSASEQQAKASTVSAEAAKTKADQYSRELEIKQADVDEKHRGNTLKYLDSQYLGNKDIGRVSLALGYLVAEGLISASESEAVQKFLGYSDSDNKKREKWVKDFNSGKTTAWSNTSMASFR